MNNKFLVTAGVVIVFVGLLTALVWVGGMAAPQPEDDVVVRVGTPEPGKNGSLYRIDDTVALHNGVNHHVQPGSLRFDPNMIGEHERPIPASEIIPTPSLVEKRGIELKLDQVPMNAAEPSIAKVPNAPDADVSLVLDNGTIEKGYGVNTETNSYQFIWLNRFTPDPSEFPFELNEIRVMFADNGGTWGVHVGDAIDLAVYEDADGDPTNGATLLATFGETIQAVDGSTWSVYTLSSPVTINGPGDVLIGVIDRFVESGVTEKTNPATFDTDTASERSWIGWWSTDPPDPPILPPDNTFDLMTGDSAGTWLIRGYGQTTSQEGIYGTVTYNGNPQAGIYLALRYNDGSAWSTWGTVVTDSEGKYLFTGVPTLGSGEKYYVRFDNGDYGNEDVTDYLSGWYSFLIETYSSGMYLNGGNFDIANVLQVSPDHGVSVSLPQTFTWTRRSATTDDSYTFNLFDYNDNDPWFETELLGYSDSYTLDSLPSGFNYDMEYGWLVIVYSPEGGYGLPYYARAITFTEDEPPGDWVNIMTEDFETNFPYQWTVFDDNGPEFGEYFWGKRNCQKYEGSYSGWGIGGGSEGVGLSCGSTFPNNVDSWMIYGPFSLKDAEDGELRFMMNINFASDSSNNNITETAPDFVFYGASIDGASFYGSSWWGNSNGWQEFVLDLKDVYTLGNLMGEEEVWIAFNMKTDADDTNNKPDGAFVDNIVLRVKRSGSGTPGYKTFIPVLMHEVSQYFEGPWEQEPNNNLSQANGLLKSGKTYHGYHNDAADYYKINVSSSGHISVKLNSQLTAKDDLGNYVVQLQLKDENGVRIDYKVGPNVEISQSITPGVYYIYIHTRQDYADPSKQYDLQVTFP